MGVAAGGGGGGAQRSAWHGRCCWRRRRRGTALRAAWALLLAAEGCVVPVGWLRSADSLPPPPRPLAPPPVPQIDAALRELQQIKGPGCGARVAARSDQMEYAPRIITLKAKVGCSPALGAGAQLARLANAAEHACASCGAPSHPALPSPSPRASNCAAGGGRCSRKHDEAAAAAAVVTTTAPPTVPSALLPSAPAPVCCPQLAEAIEMEQYDEAAGLRDRLKVLEGKAAEAAELAAQYLCPGGWVGRHGWGGRVGGIGAAGRPGGAVLPLHHHYHPPPPTIPIRVPPVLLQWRSPASAWGRWWCTAARATAASSAAGTWPAARAQSGRRRRASGAARAGPAGAGSAAGDSVDSCKRSSSARWPPPTPPSHRWFQPCTCHMGPHTAPSVAQRPARRLRAALLPCACGCPGLASGRRPAARCAAGRVGRAGAAHGGSAGLRTRLHSSGAPVCSSSQRPLPLTDFDLPRLDLPCLPACLPGLMPSLQLPTLRRSC